MAHKTKDGKKSFTNQSQARQYDKKQQPVSKGSKEVAPPETDGMDDMHDPDENNMGAPEMTQDSMDSPDGAAMAQEHGPAHKVVVQHDEGSNTHMVQADHPDGHAHMTQHGSKEAAHKFAGDCAGCGGM